MIPVGLLLLLVSQTFLLVPGPFAGLSSAASLGVYVLSSVVGLFVIGLGLYLGLRNPVVRPNPPRWIAQE